MRKAITRDSDNKVVNVVILPEDWSGKENEWKSPKDHTVRDALDAQLGDTWNGSGYDKTSGIAKTIISYESFRERFNEKELPSIKTATLQDADAMDWALLAAAQNSVNLEGVNVEAFLQKMVDAGILTSERKKEILTP